MMRLSHETLIIALVVLLAVSALAVRNFPFNQGDLDKDMPPIITSFDLFAGTSYAKYIHDSEDGRYNPPYRVMGVEKSLTLQPVYYFLFIASFTKLTSLPVYQTTPLLTHLVSVLVLLAVFFLVRKHFGWKPALFTLALGAFPTANWLFQLYIGFQYDQYAFLFVPATLIFLMGIIQKEFDVRQAYLAAALIGVFAVTQWLSHFVEFFLYLPFFAALWAWFAWKDRFRKEYLIVPLIAALVFIPFFLYFYPITSAGHFAGGFAQNLKALVHFGQASPYPSYWPIPRFTTILSVLGAIGLVYVGMKAYKRQLNAQQTLVLLFLLYLLAVGLSNYVGIDANRVSRQLFNGLGLLVFLPAIGLWLLSGVLASHEQIKRFSAVVILAVIAGIAYVAAPLTYGALAAIDQSTFVDDEKWESIRYIRDHTPSSSKVLYLNGFFHEFAMFGERPFMEGWVLPNPEAAQFNFQHLCAGNWTPIYAGHWGNGEFAGPGRYLKERTGFSTFTYVYPFDDPASKEAFAYNMSVSYVPLTFFDYAVVQHQGTDLDPCVAFFLNQSIERGHTVAWNNNQMAILKINKEARA
jgi:hypothetical protein